MNEALERALRVLRSNIQLISDDEKLMVGSFTLYYANHLAYLEILNLLGVPSAEIIPCEPEPDNAGGGKQQ